MAIIEGVSREELQLIREVLWADGIFTADDVMKLGEPARAVAVVMQLTQKGTLHDVVVNGFYTQMSIVLPTLREADYPAITKQLYELGLVKREGRYGKRLNPSSDLVDFMLSDRDESWRDNLSTPSDENSAAAAFLKEVMALSVPERSATVAQLLRERGLADETGKLLPGSTLQGSLKKLLGKLTDNQLGMLRSGFKTRGLLIQGNNFIRILLPGEKESMPDSTASEPTKKPPVKKVVKKPTTTKPASRKSTARPASQGTQPLAPPEPPVQEKTVDDAPSEVFTGEAEQEEDTSSDPGQALITLVGRRAHEAQAEAAIVSRAFELVSSLEVDSDKLPHIIEEVVTVLEQVAPRDLSQFVEALRSSLKELQADEN